MAQLHVQWMELDGPTDVMSFPMDDLSIPAAGEAAEPGILGDIVMCPQVAATQGADTGHGMTGELELLVTHGVLHCLGMDHQEDAERVEMFTLQDELLESWRVKTA
jgi:probable rRNA maturation factor